MQGKGRVPQIYGSNAIRGVLDRIGQPMSCNTVRWMNRWSEGYSDRSLPVDPCSKKDQKIFS